MFGLEAYRSSTLDCGTGPVCRISYVCSSTLKCFVPCHYVFSASWSFNVTFASSLFTLGSTVFFSRRPSLRLCKFSSESLCKTVPSAVVEAFVVSPHSSVKPFIFFNFSLSELFQTLLVSFHRKLKLSSANLRLLRYSPSVLILVLAHSNILTLNNP